MLPTVSVEVKVDKLNAVLEAVQQMASKRVLVGIPSDKDSRTDDAGITNAQLAFIHENGSPKRNIPPRKFLVPGVKAASPKCAEILKGYAQGCFTNQSAIDKGLNAAGLVAQTSVKNFIVAGEGFAPLSPGTIKARQRRGAQGTKPLIRTAQLMNSITYVVRKVK